MFSYDMLSYATGLTTLSVVCFVSSLLQKKSLNAKKRRILTVMGFVLLGLSTIFIVWLLFNKESFHWNFDIATGEAVDHYSTYGKCVARCIISLVSNIATVIIRLTEKK